MTKTPERIEVTAGRNAEGRRGVYSQKTALALEVVRIGRFPVKAVREAMGVVGSNLVERPKLSVPLQATLPT